MLDIIKIIEEKSLLIPNEIALKFESQVLTYGNLNQLTSNLASILAFKYNINPGDIIAFNAERNLDSILIILSTLKIGAAFLPISPNWPKPRIKEIFSQAKPKIVVTLKGGEMQWNGSNENIVIIDFLKLKEITAPPFFVNDFNQELLAYILFTSGSTGTPKGIKVSRESVNNLISWALKNLVCERIIVAGITRVTFDLSILDIFTSLSSGGVYVMFSENDLASPSNILRRIKLSKCTFVQTVPSLWQEEISFLSMIDYLKAKELLASIKILILAGEQLNSNLLKKMLPFASKDINIYNMYGPTETIHVTYQKVELSNVESFGDNIPIGEPIDNVYLKIYNENNQLVNNNDIGELHIGGISVSPGYVLEPNNIKDGSFYNEASESGLESIKWYRTGDIVNKKGKDIYFVGRKDDQIKIAGHRLHLSDIENIAMRNIYTEKAVAIFTANLNLFYTSSNKDFKDDDMIIHLSKFLPKEILPTKIIKVEHFPLTPNGKIDRILLSKSILSEKNYSNNIMYLSPDRYYFVECERLSKNLIEHSQVTVIFDHIIDRDMLLESIKKLVSINEIFRIQPLCSDNESITIIPFFSDNDILNSIIELNSNRKGNKFLEEIINSVSNNDILFVPGPLFRISFGVLRGRNSVISLRCHHAIASGTETLIYINILCEYLSDIIKQNNKQVYERKLSTLISVDKIYSSRIKFNKKILKIQLESRGLIYLNKKITSDLKLYFSKKNSSLSKGLLSIHIKTLSDILNINDISVEMPILKSTKPYFNNCASRNQNVTKSLPVEMVKYKYVNILHKSPVRILGEVNDALIPKYIDESQKLNRWNYIPVSYFLTNKEIVDIVPLDLYEPLPHFPEFLESSVLSQEYKDEITLIIRFRDEELIPFYIQTFSDIIDLIIS